MQEGSLVGLENPLSQHDIDVVIGYGLTRWPVVNQVYEVQLLRPPHHVSMKLMKVCIVLVEFPEFEIKELDMDASMFKELLPPLVEPLVVEMPEEALA